MSLPGLALLCLLVGTPLSAAVYQCQGPNGDAVYSDAPCGADAREIMIRPQAPLAGSSAPTRRNSGSATPHAGSGNGSSAPSARDPEVMKCQAREFRSWYDAQQPKPSREASDERMRQIVSACLAASLMAPGRDQIIAAPAATVEVQSVHLKAPAPVAGVSPTPAPALADGALQVSRSRQPEEAARWSGFYACRSQSLQLWSERLGHAADDSETREAQDQIDAECRARFGLGRGTAAVLVD